MPPAVLDQIPASVSIHPTAVVDEGAILGEEVTIGPYSVVGHNVELGAGTTLGPHVVIHPYVRCGTGCRFHSGAVIGDTPQDLAFDERTVSYVDIGDECTFREGVTVHRGTEAESSTRIGSHCFLMANAHVAHNCNVADHVIIANGALLGGHVEVGERAFISGNTCVHQFTRVGRLTMTAGLSAVSKDLPPFCTARPTELNRVAGLNTVGLRRAGFSVEERTLVKKVFHELYLSGKNVSEAIGACREKFDHPLANEMIDFVESSRRGICRYGGE